MVSNRFGHTSTIRTSLSKRLVHCLLWTVIIATISLSILPGISHAITSAAPSTEASYSGVYDPDASPPSATIAASPTKEMELVNSEYLIMNRNGKGKS